MIVKDQFKNIIKDNYSVDIDNQQVIILSQEGYSIFPILTWGMNKQEGVFCIIGI